MPEFIVGEISKNWREGLPVNGDLRPIAALFEILIARNHARGYYLYSFQLHRLMVADDEMNETIVAVFRMASPAGFEPAFPE